MGSKLPVYNLPFDRFQRSPVDKLRDRFVIPAGL